MSRRLKNFEVKESRARVVLSRSTGTPRGHLSHVRQRLHHLLESYGNNWVAAALNVSPSQPSRWRQGKEGINADNQRLVLDLDYVMARLSRLFPPEHVEIWLTSHNAHLGARPIDVLRMRGAGPVVEAIDAEEEGAYA